MAALKKKKKTYLEHLNVKNDKNLRTASLRGNLLVLIRKRV